MEELVLPQDKRYVPLDQQCGSPEAGRDGIFNNQKIGKYRKRMYPRRMETEGNKSKSFSLPLFPTIPAQLYIQGTNDGCLFRHTVVNFEDEYS